MSVDLLPDFGSRESVISYFSLVGIQTIVFLIVFFFLSVFVFSPAVKMLRLRKKGIEDLEENANLLVEKNENLKREYNLRMDGGKELAGEKLKTARLLGRRRSDAVLAEAKRETLKDLDSVIKGTEAAYLTAKVLVEKKTSQFANEIVEKIMNS